MKAFTTTSEGGGPMESQQSERQLRAKESDEKLTRRPVDWSQSTIVVNGQPMTILFPDEDKPLPKE